LTKIYYWGCVLGKNIINICIIGAHNSFNFGDDAIYIAINYFYKHRLGLNKNNCIIWTRKGFSSTKKLNYFIDINEKYYEFPLFMYQNLNLPRPIKYLIYLTISIPALVISLALYKLFKIKLFYKNQIDFFENINIIHYIGGGYINDLWFRRLIIEYLFVKIAKSVNPKIRIIGTGLGLGPFKRKLSLYLLKEFLNEFDFIFLRESKSLEIVKSLKLKENIYIKNLGDDALLLKPYIDNLRSQVNKDNSIIINLKEFPEYNKGYELIKDNFIDLVNLLSKKYKIKYACFGQKPGPDDIRIIKHLNLISEKSEILNPYEIGLEKFLIELSKSTYGIGFAYHFVIFSIMLGINSIYFYKGDYYKQKINGALEHFGLFDRAFDMEELKNAEFIFKVFVHFSTKKDYSSIENILNAKYREMSSEYLQAFLKLLGGN